jgi:DnaJ-class molecular chaperone
MVTLVIKSRRTIAAANTLGLFLLRFSCQNLVGTMDESDDPYTILGLKQDASAADIKKAYRTLALKNHPDKQCNEADREKASAIFSKIAAAYEILSDEEERKQYDMRKKYGGAPGTRYTTTSDSTPSSPTASHRTTRVNKSPSRTSRTTTYSNVQPPESGTFKFSYDPSKVRSSNPYDIFKEVFGSDFKKAYPGAELSPSKSQRSRGVPLSPKSVNITSPTTSPRKGSVTKAIPQRQVAVDSDDVVSLSKSTKTICHDDGSVEVITETTTTTADGKTKTTRESSIVSQSLKTKSPKSIKKSVRPSIQWVKQK